MKVAQDPNLELREQGSPAVLKRRYEPPRLLTETMDVRGTDKTHHSFVDTHGGASTFSGPSVS